MKLLLSIATGFTALLLLLIVWVYPEVTTAIYTVGGLFIVCIGALIAMNQVEVKQAMQSKNIRYGANSAITIVLVAAILVVINFLNFSHFYKKDFTKNKTYSLSDQTEKILKNLKDELKFTVFVKTGERDQNKALFENYKYISKKVSIEYIDPDREPNRAKAMGVKKYGTVIINSGKKESRIEEMNEEKITNAVIKVLKEKQVQVCFMTGHGEKNPDVNDADSYSMVKNEFTSQNYDSKTFNLLETGKIPETCSVLLILGPTKNFFEKEISTIDDWLIRGGKAFIALDPQVKAGGNSNKEMVDLLGTWAVQVGHDLILDPMSTMVGMNASVPIVGTYSKENAITRDFQVTTLFPLASSVDIKPNADTGIKAWWLAKSTPRSVAKTDFKEIASGKVTMDPKKDKAGPFNLMVAIEGRKGKAPPDASSSKSILARLVVVGTSQIGSNRFLGHGANLDLFMNSVSWLADDEDLISIRPKEESTVKPELSETEGRYIQLLTMILIPGLAFLLGGLIWYRRRGL